ncbi:MAG: potassium transporter Kup [Rhodospirillaceae bacterium]|nr:potassium transporter Kup [Rhodospirillaceae bacterium]
MATATPGVGAAHDAGGRESLAALSLAALGVVYGDIGTSPLYTIRQAFRHGDGLPLSEDSVLGVLSLVFWALVIVVTVKYLTVVMRADNRGEGGILALSTLAVRGAERRGRGRALALTLGIVGAALFYGDGLITPAISVLSAVEGLEIAAPALSRYVVPLSLAILVGLFVVQSRGTAGVGRMFGPVMAVWFAVLGLLGLVEIVDAPQVLRAVNPAYAVGLFARHGWQAFVVLGSVVLAITGAEALYADLGHFGRRPIRLAWYAVVLPGLLLNYFGQGALLLGRPGAIVNPFYLLAPEWALYPMVVLSTVATVIASQAVISGAFSLTKQAIQLGYLPRLVVRHTSAHTMGQVYVPQLNWLLLVLIVLLVVEFRSSSNLAAAYGVAITGAISIDSVLIYFVARHVWGWSRPVAGGLVAAFLAVDLSFFASTLLKLPQGGWFPIVFAVAVFLVISTWRQGRRLLFDLRYRDMQSISAFLKRVEQRPPARVPGMAVFMTGNPYVVPQALLHNLKHNKVLHEKVVVMSVQSEEVPRVAPDQRLEVEPLDMGFYRVILHTGYMEEPDVPLALRQCADRGLAFDLMQTSFFLSRETLLPSPRPDLPRWREVIFIALSNIASDATEFFHIPPNRVVELGAQVEI